MTLPDKPLSRRQRDDVCRRLGATAVNLALGGTLIARAVALSAGRSLSVVRCEIYALRDGEEKLCAAAQGTIIARDGSAKS